MKLISLSATLLTLLPLLILSAVLSTPALADLVTRDAPLTTDSGTNITSTQIAIRYNGTDVIQTLNRTLSGILACPDSIIAKGTNATQAWLKKHGYAVTSTTAESPNEPEGWWQDTKCALAIATFIGTNLISAAKLLKIKRYIEALGGTAEAAELLLKCSTWAERLSVGGAALVNLAAEILGVSIIKDNCT